MDPRLISAASQWRRQEQLRGLQPNHPSTISLELAPLANEGTLFDSCAMALHPNEQFLAVGMAPFLRSGPSAVGIVPLGSCTATSNATGFSLAPTSAGSSSPPTGEAAVNDAIGEATRWLDLPARSPLSSIEWLGAPQNLLLVGSSQGRILVTEQKGVAADIGGMPSQSPATIVGQLHVNAAEAPVASYAVQPTNFAATTTVRSLRRCPVGGSSIVAAACGDSVHLWDVAGEALPVLSIPVNVDDPETSVCCSWGSSNLVAVGGVSGSCFLVDIRRGAGPALRLPAPAEYAVRSIDISPVMPCAILIASSKGVLSVTDARRPSHPVTTIDALQESPVCAKWMPHHPDLFTSAGMDGTIKIWCLRSRPNYVVGCAQFTSPISHLVIPKAYAKTRIVGLSADGQLCSAALTKKALMSIAPNGLARDDAFIATQKGRVVDTSAEDAREEQRAEGLLYYRSFRPLLKAVLGAAKRRELRGDFDFALRICSLVDVKAVTGMDLEKACEDHSMDNTSSNLLQDIHTAAQRLPSTVPLMELKGFERPEPDDLIRINALKLNITMRKLLNSGELSFVTNATGTMNSILATRPDLVETDVLVGTVRFLLQHSRRDGTQFVKEAADTLIHNINTSDYDLKDGGSMPQRASHLLRALLLTASEPLITSFADVSPKKVRKIHRAFLGNLPVAKASVEAQLMVCDLAARGGDDPTSPLRESTTPQALAAAKAIVSYVAKYQSESLSDEDSTNLGVFSWLGTRPILAYLKALLTCGNIVAFFWTAQQFLDAYAQYGNGGNKSAAGAPPILNGVNTLVEAELERVRLEAEDHVSEAQQLAETEEVSLRVIADSQKVLASMHPFMLRTLKLTLECSNVAITSGMTDIPILMKGIIADITQALSECCDAWESLLGTLASSRLTDRVKVQCGPLISAMLSDTQQIADEVALDATNEGIIEAITGACHEFIDAMGATKQKKK